MSIFIPAYEAVLLAEGGYKLTDNKDDRGHQTYAGISRRSWPSWRGWRAVDNGDAPDTQDVRGFYQANFWSPMRLDEVESQDVAESVYGFAVNAGLKVAVKLAQLVVGVTPDGVVGPKTLAAINAMEPRLFLALYTVAKIARYRDIVTKDASQRKWFLGWVNRALQEAV